MTSQKDELKALQSWGAVYTQFGACWTITLHEPLLNKLQSLIEDYCEHKQYTPVFSDSYQCDDCGEVIND